MEAQHYFFIIGALILCTAPVLLLATAYAGSDEETSDRLEFGKHDTWRLLREENTHIASLSQLLRRAGLITSTQQLQALGIAFALSIVLSVAAGIYALYEGFELSQVLGSVVGAFFVSMLFAYLFLKKSAEDRQHALDQETMILIQTTRMLWRVGLSLPKTLGIICEQLNELAPNCAKELALAVNKIETGQSQEEALYQLINSSSAEGFKEYLIVIRQQAITGGSIDQSLSELYTLLQNRRRMGLQEEVNKLSGKMSLIMMLFLFPALLIFAAGPGLLSMAKSLSSLSAGG